MNHTVTIALQSKRLPACGKRSDAWLIPSRSLPATLLRLRKLVPDPEHLSFFWMPFEDVCNPEPSLFVIPAPHQLVRVLPSSAPYHRPYENCGLFLPLGTALSAALDPDELDRLFPTPVTVLHPRLGPVHFREEDRLDILDLYAVPETAAAEFHEARQGPPAPPRSLAIEPTETALDALSSLFRTQRQKSARTLELPGAGGEQMDPWPLRVSRKAQVALLGFIESPGVHPDQEPAQGWLRRLRQWAGRQLLDLQHQRDCEHLVQLLRRDPETAIRHAPPVPGSTHRPSSPRSSAARDRQSRAARIPLPSTSPRSASELPQHSAWVLDSRNRAVLLGAYRDTAQREARLGRSLNAAYIHAELLHDYRAAALVLRQASYCREAAVIYQKHLGLPLEAARCLLEGKYYREAALLFERQHEHLSAAESWTLLGDSHNARLAYQRAVDRRIGEENFIEAAHILASQLNAPDNAIELLAQRWPGARDAEACLIEELRLRSEVGDATALRQRLEQLTEGPPLRLAPALLRILASFSQSPVSPSAKAAAVDCAWNLAGRYLCRPNTEIREQLLAALPALEPGDRLLQRDATRYLARHSATKRKTRVDRTARLPCVDRVELPHRVRWRRFLPRGRMGFCAAGIDAQDSVTILRGSWEGTLQTIRIPAVSPSNPEARFRVALAWDTSPEVLSLPGTGSGWNASLPAGGDLCRSLRAENPAWVDQPGFLGMTFTPRGVAWVLSRDDDDIMLYSFSPLGDLIACRSLGIGAPELEFSARCAPVPVAYARGQLFFAAGDKFARFYRDQLSVHTAPVSIQDVVVTPPGAPVRAAAISDRNVAIFGIDDLWDTPQILPLEGPGVCAGFTLSGSVLAALPGHIELFRLHGEEPHSVAHASAPDQPDETPLGVFATDRDNVMAVATAQHIRLHKL